MSRLTTAFVMRRASLAGGSLCATAVLLAFFASGCGGGGREGALAIAPEAGYDFYFYAEPGSEDAASAAVIADMVDRLAGPGWERAREELIAAGKPAIPVLIRNLDRADPTYASVRTVPGHTVPERMEAWPLGHVVYAVLADFVGSYTNYKGGLPPADKAAWESWWRRNRRISVRTEVGTSPKYVREQMIVAREALSTRFSKKIVAATKKVEAERARKQKDEAKRLAAEEKARKRQEAQERAEKARRAKADSRKARKEKPKERKKTKKPKKTESARPKKGASEGPKEEPEKSEEAEDTPRRPRRSRRSR